jgi:hypothetical protein
LNHAILGPWRAESDGDEGARTYYVVRDSADAPCGEERIEFTSMHKAKEFAKEANSTIFKIMNRAANAAL